MIEFEILLAVKKRLSKLDVFERYCTDKYLKLKENVSKTVFKIKLVKLETLPNTPKILKISRTSKILIQ